MKSAVFERQQGHAAMALETLKTALTKFPKFAKLYMIQGQIHQAQKNFPGARASYAAGLKACPKEVTLWVLASKLEELDRKSIRARALLEKGRQFNPGSDVLWAEAVGVEERSGGAAQAKAMLARGENTFPSTLSQQALTFTLQAFRSALRLACSGQWPSGRSRGLPASRARPTR